MTGATFTDSGSAATAKLLGGLEFLAGHEVAVGLLDGKGGEVQRGDITQAGIGAVHEFGVTINVTERMRGFLHTIGIHLSPDTATITIPERSFLRSTADEQRDRVGVAMATGVDRLLAGGIGGRGVYGEVGRFLARKVKQKIDDSSGPPPPLSPATVAVKRAKGSPTPETPLKDTGGLLKAISSDVRLAGVTK